MPISAAVVQDVFVKCSPFVEMVLRSALVYVFLVVALRLSGKRLLAQLNPFDFVVLLILSNTLQNAVLGSDDTVTGGVVRAVTLLALNAVFVRLDVRLNGAVDAYRQARKADATRPRHRWLELLERAVDGSARRLIFHGAVDQAMREREGITVTQLRAALHRQGIRSVKDVKQAQLEPGGVLYVERRDPNAEATRHDDLVARLDRIEQLLAARR
jgi:uncharacterized membrane protein YcaP (DUF421 family)